MSNLFGTVYDAVNETCAGIKKIMFHQSQSTVN